MPTEDERSGSNTVLLAGSPIGVGLEAVAPDSIACLTEEEVLAFSEGSLLPTAIESVHLHLDDCATCLELVNAAVHHWERPPSVLPGDSIWMATFGPGQTISGRYEIERFVGCGGMGEVYLAFDRVLGERVALKTLLSTVSDSLPAIHRLISEARLARRVSHPNVCRVHDVGVHEEAGRVDDRLHFLTMEYIDGQRLGQLVRAGAIEIAEVIEIARQILAGLGAAHAAGVLHRDLKSDNIMVSGQGADLRIVITDFGLSQALDDDGSIRFGQERVGSVSYMAPEQLLGHVLSPATDLFAFGVVLFEMLCGQLPFPSSGGTKRTALRRLMQRATPPSTLRPEVGPGLDRVVLRCLMERPEDRWASAEQTLEMLEHAVSVGRPSAIFPKVRSCVSRAGSADANGVADVTVAQGRSQA